MPHTVLANGDLDSLTYSVKERIIYNTYKEEGKKTRETNITCQQKKINRSTSFEMAYLIPDTYKTPWKKMGISDTLSNGVKLTSVDVIYVPWNIQANIDRQLGPLRNTLLLQRIEESIIL